MITALLDGNIYDKLKVAPDTQSRIAELCTTEQLRVIATPVIESELAASHFGGIPDWFPVEVVDESVFVLDRAQLGRARLGEGEVYKEHRGESSQIPDGILADSAHAYADLLVSEDKRCRDRLTRISSRCVGVDYAGFVERLESL